MKGQYLLSIIGFAVLISSAGYWLALAKGRRPRLWCIVVLALPPLLPVLTLLPARGEAMPRRRFVRPLVITANCLVLAPLLAGLVLGATEFIKGLPACDSAMARRLVIAADTGSHVTPRTQSPIADLTEPHQLSATADSRRCAAHAIFRDGSGSDIEYRLGRRPGWRYRWLATRA